MNCGKAKKVMVIGLDGADPMLIRKHMEAGKLPNFKKIISMGVTTGDLGMQGVLPTITPPNWATLATGSWPNTHGITCFWNHSSGKPLDELDYGWNSELCKSEFIWESFESIGKKSIVFNYPTSWPPKTKNGIYIDGTSLFPNMRGYVDYEKFIDCIEGDFPIKEIPHDVDLSGTDCKVEGEVDTIKAKVKSEKYEGFGYSTTGIVTEDSGSEEEADSAKCDKVETPIKLAHGWKNAPAKSKEVVLPINSGQTRRLGLIVAEDGTNFTKLLIYVSKDDENAIGEVKVNEWSEWIFDSFNVAGKQTPVAYKLKLLSLEPDGSRMQLYYSFALDLKSHKYFYPPALGSELYEKLGPMLQPANYDRHKPIADSTVIESMAEMYEWSAKAINYLLDNKEWDLFYCHMHSIDQINHYYLDYTLEVNTPEYQRYQDIHNKIYEMSDKFVGELIQRLDEDTTILIVSDHAAVPRLLSIPYPQIGDMWGINVGVMEELGYTKTKMVNGQLEIDWENTKAIAQRAGYIYINLKGRDPQGIVEPEEYDDLVRKIIDDLYSYRYPVTGKRAISFAMNKSDMEVLGLGGPNCGDIYYLLEPECNRTHGNGLSNLKFNDCSLKNLFIMAGAGVKKGEVIKRRVRAVDIVPTICHLAGAPMPKDVEGSIIYQALEK